MRVASDWLSALGGRFLVLHVYLAEGIDGAPPRGLGALVRKQEEFSPIELPLCWTVTLDPDDELPRVMAHVHVEDPLGPCPQAAPSLPWARRAHLLVHHVEPAIREFFGLPPGPVMEPPSEEVLASAERRAARGLAGSDTRALQSDILELAAEVHRLIQARDAETVPAAEGPTRQEFVRIVRSALATRSSRSKLCAGVRSLIEVLRTARGQERGK